MCAPLWLLAASGKAARTARCQRQRCETSSLFLWLWMPPTLTTKRAGCGWLIFPRGRGVCWRQRRRASRPLAAPRAPFTRNPTLLLVLHRMAKAYGCLPSDLLRLDAQDLSICVAAYQEGHAAFAHELRRADGPVFPVLPLEA